MYLHGFFEQVAALDFTEIEMDTLPAGLQELRNNNLHLMVDEEAKLLYSKWVSNPSREEYREAIATLISCVKSKKIKYWIIDSMELSDVPMEEQVWAIQEAASVSAQSSLKKIARISKDDAYIRKVLEVARQLHTDANSGVSVQQFHSYREAAEWIEEDLLD